MVRASIRTQFLIHLVCERPALWDKSCIEYKHRELKENAWQEICTYINEDYNNLPPKEKEEYTKTIARKWSDIRSLWLKSMKYGYDEVTMRPPKPYVYHDEMQFMQKVLKWKPPDIRMYQYNNPRFAEFYRDRNESQNTNGISKEAADKTEEIVNNEADGNFSAVALKQEPSTSNNNESQFTIIDVAEETRAATPECSRTHCQTTGHNLYENRHCNFFMGILPSANGLDEDHALQFQSGVISLLQNLRQFQKLKSYRRRKNKTAHSHEDLSIHKQNSTRMLTRQRLNTIDTEDLGSDTEYLSDDKLSL